MTKNIDFFAFYQFRALVYALLVTKYNKFASDFVACFQKKPRLTYITWFNQFFSRRKKASAVYAAWINTYKRQRDWIGQVKSSDCFIMLKIFILPFYINFLYNLSMRFSGPKVTNHPLLKLAHIFYLEY